MLCRPCWVVYFVPGEAIIGLSLLGEFISWWGTVNDALEKKLCLPLSNLLPPTGSRRRVVTARIERALGRRRYQLTPHLGRVGCLWLEQLLIQSGQVRSL